MIQAQTFNFQPSSVLRRQWTCITSLQKTDLQICAVKTLSKSESCNNKGMTDTESVKVPCVYSVYSLMQEMRSLKPTF